MTPDELVGAAYDDLATLRQYVEARSRLLYGSTPTRNALAALSRVEAELARLEAEVAELNKELSEADRHAGEWIHRAETLTQERDAALKLVENNSAERWNSIETQRAKAAEASEARLREGLRRIANRYCLHTKGDRQAESACLGKKPPEEWCSICIARSLLDDNQGASA